MVGRRWPPLFHSYAINQKLRQIANDTESRNATSHYVEVKQVVTIAQNHNNT